MRLDRGGTPATIVARIVYGALVVSSGLVVAAALALRPYVHPRFRFLTPSQDVVLGLVVGGAAAVAALLLLQFVPRRSPEMDEGEWWKRALPPAALVWFAGDVAATFSAVIYLMTGRAVLLVVTALGLGILTFTSPGRLKDR